MNEWSSRGMWAGGAGQDRRHLTFQVGIRVEPTCSDYYENNINGKHFVCDLGPGWCQINSTYQFSGRK